LCLSLVCPEMVKESFVHEDSLQVPS
jgi:hypothetical protein